MPAMQGPLMAASNIFEVTVKGRGGHAAMPHLSRDPIVAAAHAITAVQVRALSTRPHKASQCWAAAVMGGSVMAADEHKLHWCRPVQVSAARQCSVQAGRVLAQIWKAVLCQPVGCA